MYGYSRVVIVGAGFGGLRLAKELRNSRVHVTLVDQHNYHTFQPLLYQVATAALDPEEIGHNVRGIFHSQHNFSFHMGKVSGVDWISRTVLLDGGTALPFDYLVLAAGAVTSDFGLEGIAQYSFGLKSIEEAVTLRCHIMTQFELADMNPDEHKYGALTFVVVGGGPTGVEMSGALREWFDMVLKKDYPDLDFSRVQVILLESTNTLLPPFNRKLQTNALTTLRSRGVDVILNDSVTRISPTQVHLKSGRIITTRTTIWAAGIRANPLASTLGLSQTRGGRIVVNPDLSVPSQPCVFVIGDMAAGTDADGQLLPQVAQVAIQGAQHVAKQIQRRLTGQPGEAFVYQDPGSMATIGRDAAVVQLPNGLKFTGRIAWMMWLFLHLMYLVGFRNRLNVFINWAWNYFTYDRSPRLIMYRDVLLQKHASPEMDQVTRVTQI